MSNASEQNKGSKNPYLIDQDHTTNEGVNFINTSYNVFVDRVYDKDMKTQYDSSFLIRLFRSALDKDLFQNMATYLQLNEFANIRSDDSFLNFLMRNGSLYVILFIVLIIITYSTNISKLIMVPLLLLCVLFINIQLNSGSLIFTVVCGIVLYAYASINNEPDMSLLKLPFPSLKNIGDFLLSDTKLYMAIILATLFWKNFKSNYQDLSFIYFLLFVQTLLFVFLRISSFALLRTSAFNPSVDLAKPDSEEVVNVEQLILTMYYVAPAIFMVLGVSASIFGMFIWNPGYKYSESGKNEGSTAPAEDNFVRFFHSIGFFAIFLYYFKSHVLLMNKLYNPLINVKRQLGKDGLYNFLSKINEYMNIFIKDITFKNIVQIFRFSLVFFIISSSFGTSSPIYFTGTTMFAIVFTIFLFKNQLLSSSNTEKTFSSNNVIILTILVLFIAAMSIIFEETKNLQNEGKDNISVDSKKNQNGVDMAIMIIYVIHSIIVNRYKYYKSQENYINKLVWTYNTMNKIPESSPLYDDANYKKKMIVDRIQTVFDDKLDMIQNSLIKHKEAIVLKNAIEEKITFVKGVSILLRDIENDIEKNKNLLTMTKQRMLVKDSYTEEETRAIKTEIQNIQAKLIENDDDLTKTRNKLKNYETLETYIYKYNLQLSNINEHSDIIKDAYSELIKLYRELNLNGITNKEEINNIKNKISDFNNKFRRTIFSGPPGNNNTKDKELNPEYYFLSDSLYSFDTNDTFVKSDYYNYGFILYMFLLNITNVTYNSYVNIIINKMKKVMTKNNGIIKLEPSFIVTRIMSVSTILLNMTNEIVNVCIKSPEIYDDISDAIIEKKKIESNAVKNIIKYGFKGIISSINISSTIIYNINITNIMNVIRESKSYSTESEITPFRNQLIESYYLFSNYYIFESLTNTLNFMFITDIIRESSVKINTNNFSTFSTTNYVGLWFFILLLSAFDILKKVATGHNLISLFKAHELADVQKNPVELFTTTIVVQNIFMSHYSKYVNPSTAVDKYNLLDKLMTFYSDENESINSLRNYLLYLLTNLTNTPMKYNGYVSFINNMINTISVVTILYMNTLKKPFDEKTKIGTPIFT